MIREVTANGFTDYGEIMDLVYNNPHDGRDEVIEGDTQTITVKITLSEFATPGFMGLRLAQTAGCLHEGDQVSVDGLTFTVGPPAEIPDFLQRKDNR